MTQEAPNKLRTIRSFVRREGRLTPGQQRALDENWPKYGVEMPASDEQLDLEALFGRSAPVTLEIGFGNGDSLFQQAVAAPDVNFLGIEVHRPGVGALLRQVSEHNLTNLRVMCEDASIIMREKLPAASLNTLQLFFPDPWPKKKHLKRRIVQSEWLDQVASALISGGRLHMATDWEHYAMHMLETTDAHIAFTNEAGKGEFTPRPTSRPLTKFEQRGHRLGHGVWDLFYQKQ